MTDSVEDDLQFNVYLFFFNILYKKYFEINKWISITIHIIMSLNEGSLYSALIFIFITIYYYIDFICKYKYKKKIEKFVKK